MTDFKQFSEKYRNQVNQLLAQEVIDQVGDEATVAWQKMLTYALLTPGKRLRPLLVLAVIDSFDQPITATALQAATALEWVHAYSLVHDDLPEMDNDAYRRGQLAVHALYGPASAVLVGDALQTGAFHLLATLPNLGAEQRLAMVQTLAEKAGSRGMVFGQVLDMANHDSQSDQLALASILDQVYQKKTADLLEAAALVGGHYLNLSDKSLAALANYAGAFGLLFQIEDDLADFDQDAEEGVVSLVHLVGFDQARVLVEQLKQRAIQALGLLDQENPDFNPDLLTSLLAQIGA